MGGQVPLWGVTAHGGPAGPLQFDLLGSRSWPLLSVKPRIFLQFPYMPWVSILKPIPD